MFSSMLVVLVNGYNKSTSTQTYIILNLGQSALLFNVACLVENTMFIVFGLTHKIIKTICKYDSLADNSTRAYAL
jgi:hypothetical protein